MTFTLTMPLHARAADLVAVLRQERAQKRRLGHDAAVEAINDILSLAKSRFDL